jgi:hypothetical protein
MHRKLGMFAMLVEFAHINRVKVQAILLRCFKASLAAASVVMAFIQRYLPLRVIMIVVSILTGVVAINEASGRHNERIVRRDEV